jgi:hypothetical protein
MNGIEKKCDEAAVEAQRACADLTRAVPADAITKKLSKIAATSGPVMDAAGQIYESKLAFATHHELPVESVLRHCAFGEPSTLAGGLVRSVEAVADSLEDAAENLRAGEYGGYTVGMLMGGCKLVKGRSLRYVGESEKDRAALLALGFTGSRTTTPDANHDDAGVAGEVVKREADPANCREALERVITAWCDRETALEDPSWAAVSNDAIRVNGNDIDIDMGKLDAPFRAAIEVGRKFAAENVGHCREREILSQALARIVKAHDIWDETYRYYKYAGVNPVEALLGGAIVAAVEILELVDRIAELTKVEA